MHIPVEIERKYVISLPNVAILTAQSGYTVSEIEQTYLESEPAVTHRVRARRRKDKTVYTETKKVRIDRMSVFEDEHEIDECDYKALLLKKAQGTVTLHKTRHTFEYKGQLFEVDVYPEWTRSAVLETELATRETEVEFPDFITVIKEVTGDKKYSNASMSHSFPDELM